MKQNFMKPSCEIVRFDNDIIRTSCGCFDGLSDWGAGANTTCNHNPECSCSQNSDPNLPNCV